MGSFLLVETISFWQKQLKKLPVNAYVVFIVGLLLITVLPSCKNRIENFDSYKISVDNKYGLIDSLGNVIISPQYLYITEYHQDGTCIAVLDTFVRKATEFEITNDVQEVEVGDDVLYINYCFLNNKRRPLFKNTLTCWCKMNYNKPIDEVIESIIYDYSFSNDGLAIIADTLKRQYGYINLKGDIVIETKYASAKRFQEGVAVVQKPIDIYDNDSYKYGYIDVQGNEVSDFIFDYLDSQSKGRAFAMVTSWIMSDTHINGSLEEDEEGNMRINETYRIDDNKLSEQPSTSFQLVDKQGRIIDGISLTNMYYGFSKDSIAIAYPTAIGEMFGTKPHYVKYDGNKLEAIESITINEVSHIMDSTSHCKGYWESGDFENVTNFIDGYAGVMLAEDIWVFVDKNLLVWHTEDNPFQDVSAFSNGLAAVKYKGKWGYIDTTFNYVVKPQYDTCYRAGRNLMKVEKKINKGMIAISYINRNGDIVWQKIDKSKVIF